jgi:hypothetical protein
MDLMDEHAGPILSGSPPVVKRPPQTRRIRRCLRSWTIKTRNTCSVVLYERNDTAGRRRADWGATGRRFESGQADQRVQVRRSTALAYQ